MKPNRLTDKNIQMLGQTNLDETQIQDGRIRLGMIGGGYGAFIGDAHRKAARNSDQYTLVGGVFDVDPEKGRAFGVSQGLSIERCYSSIEEMIACERELAPEIRIQAVSIVTPNALHYSMAKILLENGFHVICEKPMTTTIEEAEDLQRIVEETGLTFALLHTYTGYPMVRQMRQMIADGEIGEIQRVDAQYYQGWINPIIQNDQVSQVWRLNPKAAGVSSCIGDIGVHAFNLIEYTTGLEIESVLADLDTITPQVSLDLDATVMVRTNCCKGVIRSSQVACGEENALTIAVYGSKKAIKWTQEEPNFLYVISDTEPTQVYKPGHDYNCEFSQLSSTMPSGHPEGIYDAVANIYSGAAKSIRGERFIPGEFPTVIDGVRGMKFIHKVVESNAKGNVWCELTQPVEAEI